MRTTLGLGARANGPASLLAAGLLLFAALLRADPSMDGRSIAPASQDDGQAVSQVAQARSDFDADFNEQDGRLRGLDVRLRDQDGRLQETAIRVSAVARSLDENSDAVASVAKAQERLSATLEGLGERVGSLERQSRALSDAQAGASVSSAAAAAKQDALGKELESLNRELAANQDGLAEGLKELKSTQAALDHLGSMDELLALVKKDVDSNDEELVEVKQTLKSLEPGSQSDNDAWWGSVISCKYLPAVATGLGIVALGVAVFHH